MIQFGPGYAPRGFRGMTHYIVVHCSAGHPDATARDVVRYHMELRGWRSCGYHAVIERDGTIVPTLHPDAIGAHVGDVKSVGNGRAYGVCLIGGVSLPSMVPVDNFSDKQMAALASHLGGMAERYPDAEISGHRDLIRRFGGGAKACPCFDVAPWWQSVSAGAGGSAAAEGSASTEDNIDEPARPWWRRVLDLVA